VLSGQICCLCPGALMFKLKKTSCINILRNRCNTFTCEMPNNLIQRVSPAGACHALGQWLVLGWLVKESRGQFNTIPTLGWENYLTITC
jgi:hypothetical protein